MSSGTSVVPYQPKQKKPSTSAAVDNTNEIVDPMDFSFCRLENVTDVEVEEPRPSPRKGKQHVLAEGEKSCSKCLRLNNNSLSDLNSLASVVATRFEKPEDLGWIDLSFNELTSVHPVLTEFDNLQILYLHGNQIQDLKEIEKLGRLRNLKKLTLHGNPMENNKGYRQQVLSMLPNLHVLDFSCVTKADRKTAQTWKNFNAGIPRRKKDKDQEDD